MVIIRMEVPVNLVAMLAHWEAKRRWVGRIHMDRFNRRLVRGRVVEMC